jgi:hypothetical protein
MCDLVSFSPFDLLLPTVQIGLTLSINRLSWCLFPEAASALSERELVAGNEIPRKVAHRCIIEASIGKHIVSGRPPLAVVFMIVAFERG